MNKVAFDDFCQKGKLGEQYLLLTFNSTLIRQQRSCSSTNEAFSRRTLPLYITESIGQSVHPEIKYICSSQVDPGDKW